MSKQIINVGSGELVGDGEGLRSAFIKINGNFDEVYAAIDTIPTDVSELNNDVGYLTTATLPAYPEIPTNVSVFVNDSGYITADIFTNTNVGDLINNVGYLTTATLPPATNLGNLVITGTNLQTIAGTIANADIILAPNGTGTIQVPSLTLPVGSLVEEVDPIEVPIADLILDTIVDYSTGTGDTLTIGTIGNPTGIAHPWAIYRFTTTPDPALKRDDIIGGAGVPVNSVISYVGVGIYDTYIVTNKVFPLGVPVDGITITTVRPTVNASLSITTAVDTDISLKTGGGFGAIITHGNTIPFLNNEFDLGTPTKRFRQLWLGGGTIFIADDVLGIDLGIAAINGDLVVQGGAGLEVGEFTFRDNRILLTSPERQIIIGQEIATGEVVFNRPIQVNTTGSSVSFTVDRTGRTAIRPPRIPAGDIGALSIIGTADGAYQPVINPGGMIHVTGYDGDSTRITSDTFGAGTLPIFVGRSARGTASAPATTQAGDLLVRYAGLGYAQNNYFATGAALPTALEFSATDNYSPAAYGSKAVIYTYEQGSTNRKASLTVDTQNITLPAGSGVTFGDNTRQTTAWTGTVHVSQVRGTDAILATTVRSITAGNGITVSTSTGNVGIDATGVQTTVGTTNQVIVTDSGGKNLTLSLPQNINTTASVTFENITVNNITVLGTSTVTYNFELEGKILYLASSATNASQIDGGGIQLGTGTFARSILYSNGANDYWYTDPGTGFQTEHFNATTGTFTELYATNKVRFGTAYSDYDFPNAIKQSDGNANSYLQDVIKNHNSGTNASSSYAALNDQGSDGANFVTFGIASSAYNNPAIFPIIGPNDAYILNDGGNLIVNSITSGTNIQFYSGGSTGDNLRAIISDDGLDVTGNLLAGTFNGLIIDYTTTATLNIADGKTISFAQSLAFPTTNGTPGYVLKTNGSGVLEWVTPQSGPTGYTGSQGTQGNIGFTGSQGIQGNIGFTGSQGVVGFTGSQGIQGNIGFTGSQGSQGVVGFTGSQGIQGNIGFTGSQGIQGNIGFTGSTGTQGVIGFTGSQGSQGVVGFTGSQGIQGVVGFTGSTGTQGVIGFTGSQGSQGVVGFTGSQGIQGVVGFTGSTGTQGVIGYTGSASTATGYTGSQGDIGYTGSASTAIGYTGSQGDIGYTGSAGVNGVTSITGGNNIIISTSTGAVSITRIDGSQTVVANNSTATYTLLTTDQYFGSTRSTAGACTVNLPLGSAVPVGRQYVIKDEGGQSGVFGRRVTLAAAGSDTIDGSATRTITSNYGSLTVLWTGIRWSVI